MGILVEDNEEKSLLQRRINADLREKSAETAKLADVDGVEDSAMLEGTTKVRHFSWFWAILVVLALISLGIIVFMK